MASVNESRYLEPEISIELERERGDERVESSSHLPRPKAEAARLQYRTAFLPSCWMASVYFWYAPVKSFLLKSSLPSALRCSEWELGWWGDVVDMVVKSEISVQVRWIVWGGIYRPTGGFCFCSEAATVTVRTGTYSRSASESKLRLGR